MTLGLTNRDTSSYHELILAFPPRVIHNEADYTAVQAQVDRLVDLGKLSGAEEDYLDLLGTLIWEYEQRTEPLTDYALRGVALLGGLMEIHELK